MENSKPFIALTPYHNLEKDEPYMRPAYLSAVREAGGIPVILPLEPEEADLPQLVNAFDGFLFTGGPDLHPFSFGEETHRCCQNVSPKRDHLELTLLKLVLKAQKPVLGICRGIQLINVCLGGDIYQDIPSQFPEDFPIAHTQPFAFDIPSHAVTVVPDTLLEKIAGNSRIQVNSMHHQAIRKPAPGLKVTGYAPNHLAECVEMPDYPSFFLGVQWHPEYLWQKDPAAKNIFTSFVSSANRNLVKSDDKK